MKMKNHKLTFTQQTSCAAAILNHLFCSAGFAPAEAEEWFYHKKGRVA